MAKVRGEDFADHGPMTDEGYQNITQDIIKALGTKSKFDYNKFAEVIPTEADVCDYYRQFGHLNSNDAPDAVSSELHEAAVGWAEENC